MITANACVRALDRMAAGLKFFPADEGVREVIAEELGAICSNDSELDWLARRMVNLYRDGWPGTEEMRACFCSRYKPRDKREVFTAVFPGGIPSETGYLDEVEKGAIASAERQQLGEEQKKLVSAAMKQLPAPKVSDAEIQAEREKLDRTWKAIEERAAAKETERKRIILPEIPPGQRITQADIDAALAARKAGQ